MQRLYVTPYSSSLLLCSWVPKLNPLYPLRHLGIVFACLSLHIRDPLLATPRTGTIGIDDFFEHLSWHRNYFADHLFEFFDVVDEDGGVDFGDFVKVTTPSLSRCNRLRL